MKNLDKLIEEYEILVSVRDQKLEEKSSEIEEISDLIKKLTQKKKDLEESCTTPRISQLEEELLLEMKGNNIRSYKNVEVKVKKSNEVLLGKLREKIDDNLFMENVSMPVGKFNDLKKLMKAQGIAIDDCLSTTEVFSGIVLK